MNKKLILTNDGSHSLFVPSINECYHSKHGAIVEAEHVFIRNGFSAINKSPMNILEVGFGTGLNALLTLQRANNKKVSVDYHAIELYPLEKEDYIQLNFPELIGIKRGPFLKLHTCKWEEKQEIINYFSIQKYNISAQEYNTDIKFDIIYFDAFSPEKQPELWNEDIFKKMRKILKTDGFLVTYCAKGVVRRTLKKVGFEIISLDGPPGKRQMTRANQK